MARAAMGSAILAVACLPGAASAVEFSAKNCMGVSIQVLAYKSTDTVDLIPSTWVTIQQSESKEIKCGTLTCTLVVQAQGGPSLKLSQNYSTDICLVESAGNPEVTAPQAYACQPDRCRP